MYGETVSIRQADGTYADLRVWGDEFYAVAETADGYTVTRDPATGLYCYAAVSSDGRALESTGVPVREAAPAGLSRHLRIAEDAAREQALAVRADFERRAYEGPLAPRTRTERGPSIGKVEGIVLIVDFSDDPGTIPSGTVSDYCNLVGYTGFGNNGSVYDYFYDVSEGLLEYSNYVPAQYYRALHTKSYYCDPSIPYGQRARELIIEALTAMDNAGFDFSGYDADANGIIDALNCFYAGGIWNNWAEGLWPHSWSVDFCADGVCTEPYQITNMGSQLKLGTFCHENGHMLMGWPDLYDYDYDSTGAGVFCLMGYGGYASNPAEPCAYMKLRSSWADVTVLSTPQAAVQVADGGNAVYKFNHPYLSNEYYLIENRRQTGRDANLPDQGLAIWHIDTEGSNNNQQQTPGLHYQVTLVQADGRWDLEHNVNTGDATDLFAAPQYTACTPYTSPNTDWWSGDESGLSFTNIGVSADTMIFDFQDMAPPAVQGLTAMPGELSVSLAWSAVSAADFDHYRVERDTVVTFAAGVSATTADTTFVAGPLTAGTTYYFRVYAVDEGGQESDPSAIVSAIPTADVAPATPTGLLALAGGGVVELTWTPNPEVDIAGYRVLRDSTLAFTAPETLGTVPGASYDDGTCPLGRGRWYRVQAEDEAGHLSGLTAPVAGVAVTGRGIYVDDSNTGPENGSLSMPYRTILGGMGAAVSGDAVIVFAGSYGDPVQLKDGVAVVGMQGSAVTIVGGTLSATGAGSGTFLKGLLVDGGGSLGTGIDVWASDLVIEDCRLEHMAGFGVNCRYAGSPEVVRCSFLANQTGIGCSDAASPIVRSCVFEASNFAHVVSSGSPGPLVGGSLAAANDFLDRGVFMAMNTGPTTLALEYNWWGEDCVEASWFSGLVDYAPWTDATHTAVTSDCWAGITEGEVPGAAYVLPGFPNPTRGGTAIAFGLPGPGGPVTLRIYAASGRLVRTVLDTTLPAGHHVARWDGRDGNGALVSSGVYFYRLEGPGVEAHGSLAVLR